MMAPRPAFLQNAKFQAIFRVTNHRPQWNENRANCHVGMFG